MDGQDKQDYWENKTPPLYPVNPVYPCWILFSACYYMATSLQKWRALLCQRRRTGRRKKAPTPVSKPVLRLVALPTPALTEQRPPLSETPVEPESPGGKRISREA